MSWGPRDLPCRTCEGVIPEGGDYWAFCDDDCYKIHQAQGSLEYMNARSMFGPGMTVQEYAQFLEWRKK